MNNLQIRKRGGDLDKWSLDKIINSIAVCGLSIKEAEATGVLIEGWSKRNAENGVISSLRIRDKVIELLKVVEPTSADAYQAYKK